MGRNTVLGFFISILFTGLFITPTSSRSMDNTLDNAASRKMAIFKDQQMQYINAMLDCAREDRRITKEQESILKQQSASNLGSAFAKLGGSAGSQYRYQQESKRLTENFDALRNRRQDNENRLKDLEIRKGDLKLKMMEVNGGIPAWWDENEAYYLRMRSHLISP